MARPKGWQARFYEPVTVPGGRRLLTLGDAGEYIASLPGREQQKAHWQAATQALMIAAGPGDPFLGRVAILHGLRGDSPPAPKPPRKKRARGYRIIR